jgi:hypothetical protein
VEESEFAFLIIVGLHAESGLLPGAGKFDGDGGFQKGGCG